MTQYLGTTETFSDSRFAKTTDWEDSCLWWTTKLWTDEPESTTGFGIYSDIGWLHEGYGSGATSANYTGISDPPIINAYTYRRSVADECEVRAGFQHVIITGSDQTDSFTWCGVGARLQAGTNTLISDIDSRDTLYRPSGYFFVLANRDDTGSVAQWLLLFQSSASASPTVLAESAEFDISTLAMTTQRELRIVVKNSTGASDVVRLWGYTTKSGQAEELVIYTEHAGSSALTQSGHACLLLPNERDYDASNTSRVDCLYWEHSSIDEAGNATLLARDEFDRANIDNAIQITDHLGQTGYSVMGAYTGDRDGRTNYNLRLKRDTTVGNERILADDSPATGFHFEYEPPSNIYEQRNRLVFEFASGADPGTRYAGLLVRCDFTSSADMTTIAGATDRTGYFLAIQLNSGTWQARLWRYGTSFTQIAAKTLTGMSTDTRYEITLHVYNGEGPGAHEGYPKLRATLDGSAIAFGSPSADVSIDNSTRIVTDAHSQRIESGPTMGLFVQATATDDVYIYEYSRLAVGYGPTSAEYASVTVPLETDGATGTLTVPHEWPVTTEYDGFLPMVQRTDHGSVYYHSQTDAERRRWRINARAITTAQKDSLRSFWDSHLGVEVPFNWSTPSGEAVVVGFLDPRLETLLVNPDINQFDVVLEERL